MIDIPKRCPKIDECDRRVTAKSYERTCTKPKWIYCRYAQKYANEYKYTPKEWKKREVVDQL